MSESSDEKRKAKTAEKRRLRKELAAGPVEQPSKRSEVDAQIDYAETLYVRRLRPTKITKLLSERFGISESAAADRLLRVRTRWEEEAQHEGAREARREHLERTIEDVAVRAFARQREVKDRNGNPVVLTNADGSTRLATLDDPDLRTALVATKQLGQLRGLFVGEASSGKSLGDLASAAAAALMREKMRAEIDARRDAVDRDVKPENVSESDHDARARSLRERALEAAGRFEVIEGGKAGSGGGSKP